MVKKGRILSAGGGIVRGQFIFTVKGSVVVATDVAHRLRPSGDFEIQQIFLEVKAAPVGADLIVDINVGGVSIFSNPSERPRILAGAKTGVSILVSVFPIAENAEITVDVDQIGSSTPGADLTVHVRGEQ